MGLIPSAATEYVMLLDLDGAMVPTDWLLVDASSVQPYLWHLASRISDQRCGHPGPCYRSRTLSISS